jgi:hypothetical protein
MYIALHITYPLFFSDFNELEFSLPIFEKYTNFMNIRPMGAELFHADRRTDMTN